MKNGSDAVAKSKLIAELKQHHGEKLSVHQLVDATRVSWKRTVRLLTPYVLKQNGIELITRGRNTYYCYLAINGTANVVDLRSPDGPVGPSFAERPSIQEGAAAFVANLTRPIIVDPLWTALAAAGYKFTKLPDGTVIAEKPA